MAGLITVGFVCFLLFYETNKIVAKGIKETYTNCNSTSSTFEN
ncbi:MAG: hypothetical protein K0R18_2341 [Bacillales bacterium]|jgi:hypothetical protein|nr:hypothetical protein [Bacillales bacterium]